MYNTKYIRSFFPIYKKYPNLVYFDSAASSLVCKSVIASQNDYYSYNGTNVHRGTYKLSYNATQAFEESRMKVAKFINSSEEEVIFTKGTTNSLNMLARSLDNILNTDDEILTSYLDHHSSFLPYEKYKINYIPLINNRITLKGLKKVMNDKIRVVTIPYVSNTLGYLTPLDEIIPYLRQFNCYIILDCAQSILDENIDVKKLDVDFLAFSAHKIFGPNGVGVLYGKKHLLNKLTPFEYGGEMVEKVTPNGITIKDSPYRHEAGTPNIAGVIGLGFAVDFITELGKVNIKEHTMKIRKYLISKLSKLEHLTIYNKKAEAPIILFNVDGVHPHDIASILDTKDVCVRAGFHCAQLISTLLDDSAATLRASIGIYNNKKDADKLVDALKVAITFFKG